MDRKKIAIKREFLRQMKKEAARRAELRKLPPPAFDGFADSQRTHQSVWGDPAMAVKICTDREPCCALVTLYAKMGLHRYNLLHRTNLEFVKVEKYNYFIPMRTTVYYITFVASDPASSLTQIFQTRVGESDRSMFALSCSIARRLGDDEKPSDTPSFFRPNLPEWPPENPFDQFYVPDESEVQCIDWVRLYLELAVVISDRSQSHDLTSLEIVKVAIDATTSMEEEGLNYAKNATVYIRYKDYCEARVGKDVDRIAIVRRSYDDVLGLFHLEGQSSPGIMRPEMDNNKNLTSCSVHDLVDKILEGLNQCVEKNEILWDQNHSSSSIMMPEKNKVFENQSSSSTMVPEKNKAFEILENQSSLSTMMPKKDKKFRSTRLLFSRLGINKPGCLSIPRKGKKPGLHKARSI